MTHSLEPSSLLFATVLVDTLGSRTARQLVKTQISSLLRFFFNGEIVVWRNIPEVLYPVARVGVHEFDFVPLLPLKKGADLNGIILFPREILNTTSHEFGDTKLVPATERRFAQNSDISNSARSLGSKINTEILLKIHKVSGRGALRLLPRMSVACARSHAGH